MQKHVQHRVREYRGGREWLSRNRVLSSSDAQAGWDIDSPVPEEPEKLARWQPQLRAYGSAQQISIYPMERNEEGIIVSHGPDQPREYVIEYRRMFSGEQLRAAIETILTPKTAPDVLLMFSPCINSKPQRQRLHELIDAHPAQDVEVCLELARWKADSDPEKAQELLLRARALQFTADDRGAHDNAVRDIAKKLHDESLAKQPLDEQDFRNAGYVEICPDMEPTCVEIEVGQAARFIYRDDGGELRAIRFLLVSAEDKPLSGQTAQNAELQMSQMEAGSGDWSSTQTTARPPADGSWTNLSDSVMGHVRSRFVFRIRMMPAPGRFQIQSGPAASAAPSGPTEARATRSLTPWE